MPTLLENPTSPAPLSLPSELLHKRHRWERWRAILVISVTGLAATLVAVLALHHVEKALDWKILAATWVGGLVLTALAAPLGRHLAPKTIVHTAQHMDETLTAKNRLETAATLHGSTAPLALAQREETEAYLRRAAPTVRPVRILPWLVGGLLVLIAAHLLTMAVWMLPVLTQPTPPPPPPPKKETPQATIVWKSPAAESKANPVQEVPTVAVAQSTSGLKNMTLEISVNGVAKKSVPLPAAPLDKPGRNTIKVSIYMDELGVEPFDVVSYFLRGQRIFDQPLPDTTSPIQFIEVRPFRDDVTQEHGAEGDKTHYDLLIRLKLAQLHAVKENFILAHTDLPVTDPLRIKENTRIGQNQGELAKKTEEVVQSFMNDGVPTEMIDLLQQAEPPMRDASTKVLANQNVAALVPQQKALSLIIEVEKFFHKVMADKGAAPPDNNPADPFKDKQQHELKKRMEMAAGQLEQLARNQTKLSNDLNQPSSGSSPSQPSPAQQTPQSSPGSPAPQTPSPDNQTDGQKEIPLPAPQAVDPFSPDSGKGTHAERQARVLQGIGTLLNTNTVLPPAVNDALHEAQKDAGESQSALDQSDEAGAREPAAAAAQALQRAVAEMIKAGDEATKIAMEDAQQKLNDEAQRLDDMAQKPPANPAQDLSKLANDVHQTQQALDDAADQQQEAGSAAGAEKLNQLAKDLSDKGVEKDLAAMSKQDLDPGRAKVDADKLSALAAEAAREAHGGKLSAHDLTQLINALEASRANLAHLAQQDGAAPAAGTQPNPAGNQPAPGTTPDHQGQQPGKDQGQGAGQDQGQHPDAQPNAQDQGQQPGKDQGQRTGQDQGQHPDTQANAQDQSQNQGQGQGQGEGRGQGQHPDAQTNAQDHGQGRGPGPGHDHGGQGEGADNAQTADLGGGSGAQGAVGPGGGPTTKTDEAYREVLADLKDEAQMTKAELPSTDVSLLLDTVQHAQEEERSQPNSMSNMTAGYRVITAPLDQLIRQVEAAMAQAQRGEVVKQPDLDDAPAAYRSAVSDYFETMSKDYHPDSGDADATKP